MTAMLDGRLLVTRHEAALLLHRHPDQVRRRCTAIATDPATGAALYDLEAADQTFRHVPRRVKLT